jgi:hypothetical protein
MSSFDIFTIVVILGITFLIYCIIGSNRAACQRLNLQKLANPRNLIGGYRGRIFNSKRIPFTAVMPTSASKGGYNVYPCRGCLFPVGQKQILDIGQAADIFQKRHVQAASSAHCEVAFLYRYAPCGRDMSCPVLDNKYAGQVSRR